MICLILGTNRAENRSRVVTDYIQRRLEKLSVPYNYVDLSTFKTDILADHMYKSDQQLELVSKIQDDFLKPARKLWFVTPEYNGSFPGVLKVFIDAISVRDYKDTFSQKKACLTGVATGRAGNLRGMDHLSDILNHLGVVVLPNKLPISSIDKLMSADGLDEVTSAALDKQIDTFLEF